MTRDFFKAFIKIYITDTSSFIAFLKFLADDISFQFHRRRDFINFERKIAF